MTGLRIFYPSLSITRFLLLNAKMTYNLGQMNYILYTGVQNDTNNHLMLLRAPFSFLHLIYEMHVLEQSLNYFYNKFILIDIFTEDGGLWTSSLWFFDYSSIDHNPHWFLFSINKFTEYYIIRTIDILDLLSTRCEQFTFECLHTLLTYCFSFFLYFQCLRIYIFYKYKMGNESSQKLPFVSFFQRAIEKAQYMNNEYLSSKLSMPSMNFKILLMGFIGIPPDIGENNANSSNNNAPDNHKGGAAPNVIGARDRGTHGQLLTPEGLSLGFSFHNESNFWLIIKILGLVY
ncbi:hypothetical protein ACJX0J_038039, partial [Zea mays]